MLTFTSDDGGLQASVWFDRWDSYHDDRARWNWNWFDRWDSYQDNLARWNWKIHFGDEVLSKGDDLTIIDPKCSEVRAMAALAVFFDSYIGNVRYGIQDPDDPFDICMFDLVSAETLKNFAADMVAEFGEFENRV